MGKIDINLGLLIISQGFDYSYNQNYESFFWQISVTETEIKNELIVDENLFPSFKL